ncbi:hypothetical protein QBC33DRAFT_592103 [Phialemonium atrogriseum]|uniref:Cns1/TTC4 wheel domain-containing protein n=1 Tax=Phialemonium atrogriseum TaxID=1093897 RepID=A0AAJ0C819_9PEZI|nr:uncharacterized protein QBC33DRAFT_592103 [Phialemonium atrogriseum]KAK1771655.1 hypothetical protein QBC33DRAFT_592103 [Phialemonium atrogriseum]
MDDNEMMTALMKRLTTGHGEGQPIPELPPSLAFTSGKSSEEILADLNKSPLFMTELEENDDVAALQALAYEGTPLENATNFKEQGNECFKEKKWADAKEFYGKGIQIVVAEDRRRDKGEPPKEGDSDSPDEVRKQHAVLEVLYVNRAASHLELRNYRSCTQDCAGALRLNPRNVKAYYRSARALLALGKVREADDACARGLAVAPENAALGALSGEIAAAAAAEAAKSGKERAAAETAQRRARVLKAALRARGVRMRATEKPPEMEDARLQLTPDPEDPKSALSFPTVLLYPAHLESDFIKAFDERECLEQHFGYVFPLPWDRDGSYSANNVQCYMETLTGGLVKVGKKVPLLKVLSAGNVEIVDELVKIFVVPKSKAEGWVQEFKMKKAAEKGVQK